MTRKNKGLYEPEFRIVLVIPQLIFGCAGLYLFGVTSATLTHYSWILPVFAFGLEVGGMVIGAVASSLYIVDAHSKSTLYSGLLCILTYDTTGDIAIEAFTCMIIFKVSVLVSVPHLADNLELLLLWSYLECLRMACPRRYIQDLHVDFKHPGSDLPSQHPNV